MPILVCFILNYPFSIATTYNSIHEYILEPNLVLCKAALNAVDTSLQLSNAELKELSISQTISNSILSISQTMSSSTLSISATISSSTLLISPTISSSVLRLCYATYQRTTSTTTTSQLNKFAQSTPTSGISSPNQGS